MYSKSDFLPEGLRAYLRSVAPPEADILRRLREETASHPLWHMQIPPEQGSLLALLALATGARRCLEIGVFTGYSSLAVALVLPAGGRLVALDASEEYTAVARRYWKEAEVEHKIDLRLGPAAGSLRGLLDEGLGGAFDFAFIDADKPSYNDYYEHCLRLLRPGGLLAIDNIFLHGKVQDPNCAEEGAVSVRRLNARIRDDARVIAVVLPFADGVTLAVKK